MKRFDLMSQVNSRGSFLCAQACLPHLLQASNPHILTLAPPPSLDPKWWAPHTGYTLAKMGMSFVTLGLAAEFGPQGVAVNALWPRTLIATEALNMIPGVDAGNGRKPEIMADAAHAVLVREARGFSGQFPDRRRSAGGSRRHRSFAATRSIRRSRCCRICSSIKRGLQDNVVTMSASSPFPAGHDELKQVHVSFPIPCSPPGHNPHEIPARHDPRPRPGRHQQVLHRRPGPARDPAHRQPGRQVHPGLLRRARQSGSGNRADP